MAIVRALAIIIPFLFSQNVIAGDNTPGFVNLIPPDIDAIVDGNGSISDYCKKHKDIKSIQCRGLVVEWSLNVYEEPSLESKKMGRIVLKDLGLESLYISASGRKSPYEAILKKEGLDRFPMLRIHGDWIQLPKRPFEKPVWVNIVNEWGIPLKRLLDPLETEASGAVYNSKKFGEIIFTDIGDDFVRFRNTDPDELRKRCEGGGNPVVRHKPGKKIPISDLLDKDNHLQLVTATPKGC